MFTLYSIGNFAVLLDPRMPGSALASHFWRMLFQKKNSTCSSNHPFIPKKGKQTSRIHELQKVDPTINRSKYCQSVSCHTSKGYHTRIYKIIIKPKQLILK